MATEPPIFVNLTPGDPAPWFRQRCGDNPRYSIDTVGGRYVVLCFFGSAGDTVGAGALQAVRERRANFDDARACFFGVTLDPADVAAGRVEEDLPGLRFFQDWDGTVSRAYGAIPKDAVPGPGLAVHPLWIVLDPTLRVMKVFRFAPDGSDRAALFAFLDGLPPPDRFAGIRLQAPILFLPGIFEPELCDRLIGLHHAGNPAGSGFMREINGKTVMVMDTTHKVRRDAEIVGAEVLRQVQTRISRRLIPEIAKAHQFHVTRIERNIVACYAADEGGHFRAHRDNTTKGTAHRRFAVSINLNADFDGGDIAFPEYGSQRFRPPPGGAVVFSCSLLHGVSRVTRGRRYAFLPFLYDDAAAEIRTRNLPFVAQNDDLRAHTE